MFFLWAGFRVLPLRVSLASLDFPGQDTQVQVPPGATTTTTAATENSMEKPAPASKPPSNVSCIWTCGYLHFLPTTYQASGDYEMDVIVNLTRKVLIQQGISLIY